MAYSVVAALLIGDLVVSGAIDKEAFVTDAANEIDSRIGHRYVVPIPQGSVLPYVWNTLVRINNHIASGRLLMATDQSGEKSGLHAYGDSLVKNAMADLMAIANGGVELVGAALMATVGGTGDGPSILTFDRQSGVDTIYDYLTDVPVVPYPVQPYDTYWRPGPRGGTGSPPNGAVNPVNPTPNTGYTDPTTGEEIDNEGNQRGRPGSPN